MYIYRNVTAVALSHHIGQPSILHLVTGGEIKWIMFNLRLCINILDTYIGSMRSRYLNRMSKDI